MVANDPVCLEVFNRMSERERLCLAFGKAITMNAKRQLPLTPGRGPRCTHHLLLPFTLCVFALGVVPNAEGQKL